MDSVKRPGKAAMIVLNCAWAVFCIVSILVVPPLTIIYCTLSGFVTGIAASCSLVGGLMKVKF